MSGLAPYRQRVFANRGLWRCETVTFKAYTICAQDCVRDMDGPLRSATEYLNAHFPEACRLEGENHQLGYVILHLGEMADWLLIHWWAHNDIVLAMLASAPCGGGTFASVDDRRFHACVWEHVVIHHERDAWVRFMNAGGRDGAAYLNDTLADGFY